MADRPPETGDDSGAVYEREPAGRVPRWLKVVGIVAAIVIVLVVVILLLLPGGDGGGGHGPGRHASADGPAAVFLR